MAEYNGRRILEEFGIKTYCMHCDRTFSNAIDFVNHMVVSHNETFSEELLNKLNFVKCEGAGCVRYVNRSSSCGKCRACRQLGNANPVFNCKDKAAWKEKVSKASKSHWQNPEYREKVISGVSKPRPEAFKREQSERIKQWYIDNPEQRDIRSAKMRAGWQNGTYFSHQTPMYTHSKAEQEIFDALHRIWGAQCHRRPIRTPGHVYYPDICIKAIVVEYFGDYWHANPLIYEPDDVVHHGLTAQQIWQQDCNRIRAIEGEGYGVIIIWESEYANRESDEAFYEELDRRFVELDELNSL